jgi:hypothetical protein
MDPTLFALIIGPGKIPAASVALGCTGSDTVRTAAAKDPHARKSIRSYDAVDYGKRDADGSSGDSLGDSGEE